MADTTGQSTAEPALPVIGFIRFSVVTQHGRRHFRLTKRKPMDDAVAAVLAPERLVRRFALLDLLPLAALDRQSDTDFKVVVLYSTLLGKADRKKLAAIAAAHSYLVLHPVKPRQRTRSAARDAAAAIVPDGRFVSFRLDDDDAVDPDFIARLRARARHGADDTIISFSRGVYLQRTAEGFDTGIVDYPGIAIGLSLLSSRGSTIFDAGAHDRLDPARMTVNDSPIGWLRTLHAGSDSGTRIRSSVAARAIGTRAEDAASLAPFDFLDLGRIHLWLDMPDAVATPSAPQAD